MSLYEIKNSMIDNLLGFDFNMVEGFSMVDSSDATTHLRHNNHVAEISAH